MDLADLKQKIDIIDDYLNKEIDVLYFTPTLGNTLRQQFTDKKDLLNKYSADVVIKYVAFRADNENNEPLGFKCESWDSDDDIELQIGNHHYSYKNSAICNGLTISWNNINDYYNEGYYHIIVEEVDTISSNEKYEKDFELSRDDIIDLINGKEISKDIGNGYYIILRQ
jgi:hypothetical protein